LDWNILAVGIIPKNLPKENILPDLRNAIQKSKYRGPNPPKGIRHKYQFNIYVLDCELTINKNSNKKQLEKAMEGHIIQYGFINGYFE
jgi:Raf kinase inhibitor-like YbhB/YbcL family protein